MIRKLCLGLPVSTLVGFLSTTLVWAQPQGPWVVMEGVDSVQSLQSVMISVATQQVARVFWVADSSGHVLVQSALYGIDEHAFIDSIRTIRTDSLSTVLKDVSADSTDKWVLIFDRHWSIDSWSTMAAVGHSGVHNEYLVGRTWPWNQYLGGEFTSKVDLAHRVGGGWIATWVRVHVSTIYYEPESQVYVAGLTADSLLYRQPLIPYECELFGPNTAAGISISSDTALVLTQSAWCWNYGAYASAIFRAVAGGDSSTFDTVRTLNCDVSPIDVESDGQGGYFAYSADWESNTELIRFDTSGMCQIVTSVPTTSVPWHLAFHPNYGYAGIWYAPSWIKIGRIDIDGTPRDPGIFYWHDSDHLIRSAALAITDDGRIHVAWVEGPADTTRNARLMAAWMNWNTPLSANPPPERTAVWHYELNAYPNPFNSSVRISYDLPRAGEVKLEVFDVLGRQVRTLVDRTMSAGAHTVTWSPDGPSGLYFISLHAGAEARVQKIVYLR